LNYKQFLHVNFLRFVGINSQAAICGDSIAFGKTKYDPANGRPQDAFCTGSKVAANSVCKKIQNNDQKRR
jgi:hypothetical protein